MIENRNLYLNQVKKQLKQSRIGKQILLIGSVSLVINLLLQLILR